MQNEITDGITPEERAAMEAMRAQLKAAAQAQRDTQTEFYADDLRSDYLKKGECAVFICADSQDVKRVDDVAFAIMEEADELAPRFSALPLRDTLQDALDRLKAENASIPPLVFVPDGTEKSLQEMEAAAGRVGFNEHAAAIIADVHGLPDAEMVAAVRDAHARALDAAKELEAQRREEAGCSDEESGRIAQELRVRDMLRGRDGYRRRTTGGAYTRIQTGIGFVDDLLGGGLSTVLTLFGARTGIGKTTLCLQIADSIAESGRPVLYAALEMTADELAAKSIARIYNQAADNTVSYGELLENRVPDNVNRSALRAAEDRYFDWAEKNMYVRAGREPAAKIAQAAQDIAQTVGIAPVVFVDYLQYLLPADARLTDKQNTDSNVDAVKRICQTLHTPVIAISSLNRASYGSMVKDNNSSRPRRDDEWFEVFESGCKESGGIEYTAEIQLFMRRLSQAERRDDLPEWEYPTRLYLGKNRAGRGFKTQDVIFNGWRGSFEQWSGRDAKNYAGNADDIRTLFDAKRERQRAKRGGR